MLQAEWRVAIERFKSSFSKMTKKPIVVYEGDSAAEKQIRD